ncbi:MULTISPECIES: phage tail tape measure protein [Pantoea]|uniref:Tail protein n=2 Tax=Pantoea TaxID=53335 RepID=A0A0U3T2I9_9GAMM|nr:MULTISPECIES: phage tail tape measure protein [Pantoea]ALV92004.1 tail protein [Pantoea vagans]KHJ65985.1 tail protein [Pantoea rodasii]
MSNNLKVQVLLNAVDKATRPFKTVEKATKGLTAEIRQTQTSIKELDAQSAKIDGFRKTSAQLAVTSQKLKEAKAEAESLAVAFKNTERPTTQQARALEKARQAASELQTKSNALRLSVQQQREALTQAGISTRSLSTEQQRLKSASAMATVNLSRQKQELQRLNMQQERLNQTSERYRRGQELSAKVRNAGAAGIGTATVGAMAARTLLTPGFDFAQKNSELQAVLGLAKDSAEMTALRLQARQLGDTTAASSDDAAGAQIIIAKSGGDAAAIQAATPVTLNMALANKRTMEENAGLLMGMKSAFELSNDKVAHIGDVLSMTMNKTAADFDGMSDALTYAAPVAKNAGVSIEETAAMVGALHDAKITGSMAGTGSRAVLSRLQAPTGQAYKAITELGIKTSDSKGNTRPIFAILKEMQASFDRNKLGTGQRAEYMKAIFGEEASSSAAVLMSAAYSGKLDRLTATFKASDGKTAELVEVMQDNLGGDLKELQSAYEAIGTDLFDQQDSGLRKLTQGTAAFLLTIDNWIKANPALASGMGKIAAAGLIIIGVLGAVGLVAWPVIAGVNAMIAGAGLLGSAFSIASGAIATALGAITLPVVAVAASIVAGALLVRKYWEPISAFISGFAEGFTAAMGPIGSAFGSLTPIFSAVGDKIKELWDWFGKLLGPVKSTQTELAAAGDMGKKFGNMLAEALKIPGQALDQLRSGIDWVLEKLGIIDTKSDGLKDKVPSPDPIATGGAGVDTGGLQYSLATGGAPYRPVTAPSTGGGIVDRSQNTYQYEINMHEGMTKDDALALMAQHQAREQRNRQAQNRSKMGWED